MGSVKDLVVIKNPYEKEPGLGRFVFSDRYSVYDWGEMPDHIENKGKALCIVSAYFFEKLKSLGIKTHYLGLLEEGKVKKIESLKEPSNIMEIKLLRVLKPEIKDGVYDYSIYKKEKFNFLIPLEVIYRNSLPEGSSVFKRLKEGKLKLEDIGLSKLPEPGEKLDKPLIDFSTKLEVTDRYISFNEAKNIAGLSDREFEEIKEKTLFINNLISEEVKKLNLNNEDGKFEFGFDEKRNVLVVDVIGTLDECRFTYEGVHVSKEIARIYYRKTEWFEEIERAKKIDSIKWKSLVKIFPPNLKGELKKIIEDIYKSFANEITGREWFKTPPLKEVLKSLADIIF